MGYTSINSDEKDINFDDDDLNFSWKNSTGQEKINKILAISKKAGAVGVLILISLFYFNSFDENLNSDENVLKNCETKTFNYDRDGVLISIFGCGITKTFNYDEKKKLNGVEIS